MIRPKMWVNTKITPTSGAFELIVIEVIGEINEKTKKFYLPTLDGGYVFVQHFHHWTEEQLQVSLNSEHDDYDIVHIENEIE